MSIQFSDVSGEYYDMGRTHDEEVRKRVKEYDVFLIAIDTPNLMEAINPDNRLCNEAINNSYNHVNDIYTFLSELDDKDGADAKLVIFVPLKCEKWAKEGKINQVVERVKTVYAPSLHALSQYTNVEVDIMPIQTVGNIVFQEQAKAMSCIINGITQRKCAIINKKRKCVLKTVLLKTLILQNIDFKKTAILLSESIRHLLFQTLGLLQLERNTNPGIVTNWHSIFCNSILQRFFLLKK